MRISFTISRYIFMDLLRIFLMASGALAGIMSFGGLLRPLTQQGLDATQVGQLLSYLTPAMTAYSYPIAALFATTVVYGRLSADNELTACRAGGISHLAVAVPALVLGLLVALISFLFLSFLVPSFTLKAEKVIFSNIAKVVANRIDRTRQIKLEGYTVFAQGAHLPEAKDLKPGQQQVILEGPTIVSFTQPRKSTEWNYRVPKEFWTARSATLYIDQPDGKAGEGEPGAATRPNDDPEDDDAGAPDATEDMRLTVALDGGSTFPRDFRGAVRAGVETTQFGPIPMTSPIKENTKFMSVGQLKHLYENPQSSLRIRKLLASFIRFDQEFRYLHATRDALNNGPVTFRTTRGGGEEYVLERGPERAYEKSGELVAPAAAGDPARAVRLRRWVNGREESVVEAREARVRVWPRRVAGEIDVQVRLIEAVTLAAEGPVPRGSLPVSFTVKMPPAVSAMQDRPLDYYTSPAAASAGKQNQLVRELIVLGNDIVSESHARACFAVSCLILVLVGCALGMMFRSGNFLTAFAVSFVPALLSITLIIAGQRVCGNVPWQREGWTNPLPLGVAIMWSGNAANLVIATVLLGRLWRT